MRFAYMSVDFANPTAETIDRAGHDNVLALAEALEIALIEDAAYQALRYDGEAISPILALEIAAKDESTRAAPSIAAVFPRRWHRACVLAGWLRPSL